MAVNSIPSTHTAEEQPDRSSGSVSNILSLSLLQLATVSSCVPALCREAESPVNALSAK